MEKERAMELLSVMTERIVTGENLTTTIRTMIEVGFKKEEMKELNFNAGDIETVYEEIILEAVDDALMKYSSDNVDVVRNEETGYLYVAYHSDNNSFPLSDELCLRDDANLDSLTKALDKRNVGQCWW